MSEKSGKFIVRTPPELHRKLALLARREGVSLNLLVSCMRAEHVGRIS